MNLFVEISFIILIACGFSIVMRFLKQPFVVGLVVAGEVGGNQGAHVVVFVPQGIGERLELMDFGVGPGKGIEAVGTLVIIAIVAEDAQGHLALELFEPDVVGLADGDRQQPLGGGEKKQGEDQGTGEDRADDQAQRDPAGLKGG